MSQIKIAIAEDHEAARNALVKFLHTEKEIIVVLEAENGKELIKNLNFIKTDVILMDIRMPIMDGLEASRVILQNDPCARIIAWTMFEDELNIVSMNKLGVKSFLYKDDIDELFKAIRIVYSGGVYLPNRIAQVLRKYIEKRFNPCPFDLSDFELALVKAICKGYSSTKIGELIGKSSRTVEDYRNDLYEKFEVANKESFIVKATIWGLMEMDHSPKLSGL